MAAMVAERLYEGAALAPGVFHIEQVFEPREAFARLESEGFEVHLAAPERLLSPVN